MKDPRNATSAVAVDPVNSYQIGQNHAAATVALWVRQNAAPPNQWQALPTLSPTPELPLTAHPNRIRSLDAARARRRPATKDDASDKRASKDGPASPTPVTV